VQREAIKGLLKKTGIAPTEIDYVSCGTVIQEVFTSNIAREAAMAAGIPLSTPAHTVTLACISSNVAMGAGIDKIKTGQVPPPPARVRPHTIRVLSLAVSLRVSCSRVLHRRRDRWTRSWRAA
jgi:hypothetical protein